MLVISRCTGQLARQNAGDNGGKYRGQCTRRPRQHEFARLFDGTIKTRYSQIRLKTTSQSGFLPIFHLYPGVQVSWPDRMLATMEGNTEWDGQCTRRPRQEVTGRLHFGGLRILLDCTGFGRNHLWFSALLALAVSYINARD
jgi:hypothetical protein